MNNQNTPLYSLVYDYLVKNIHSGVYKINDMLPTEKEMSEKFNVSRITSKKAFEMLVMDGYIKRIRGKGSFVISKSSEQNDKINLDKDVSSLERTKKIIGVVLSDFDESYGSRLLSGIERQASVYDYYMIVKRSRGKQENEEIIINEFIKLGVDGIIVFPLHGECYNTSILQMVVDKYPFVIIDRFLTGISAPFVGSDNYTAAKRATNYLIELGHKKIGFISSTTVHTSTTSERKAGFVDCFEDNDLICDKSLILCDMRYSVPGCENEDNLNSDMEKIKNMIAKNSDISALFITEYNIALLVARVIKEMGFSIPTDISIICFDGPKNEFIDYFFTHVRQNEQKMGEIAVSFLNKLMSKEFIEDNKVLLDAELVIGESTTKYVPKYISKK